jgi:hypothetical protein
VVVLWFKFITFFVPTVSLALPVALSAGSATVARNGGRALWERWMGRGRDPDGGGKRDAKSDGGGASNS